MEEREIRSRTGSERRPPRGNTGTDRAGRTGTSGRDSEVRKRPAGGSGQSAHRPEAERNRTEKRKNARRHQARRRRKRNLGLKIAFLSIFTITAVAAVFLWNWYGPANEMANLKEYYGIENDNQLAVVVDNEVLSPTGMIFEGKAYLQYETVRDYVSSRFYWDPNENLLLYTLPADIVSVGVGSKDYAVSKEKYSEEYIILKTEGSTAYIALDFIQQYVDIEYEVYDEPDRVVVDSEWGQKKVAAAKRDTEVRYRGGMKSPILTEISKKEEVVVLEDENDWQKVRTADGYIGYVWTNSLGKIQDKTFTREFEEQVFTNIQKDYTINMAWHNVTNTSANDSILQKIADTKGLTTISPTWFSVADVDGNMTSVASADYVNYAHQANIEVWAAIRDFDGGISSYDESFQLLSHTSRRENLINQLMAEVLRVGADGINVDFEQISEECGEHYIQFIRELSVRCRQNGIVLSVDNYVPMSFNMHYNRAEQGVVADYIVIMGYDEHYGGSPEAGPVSSYEFVKNGIEQTMEEVPAEKIISGIPFFTRLWEETPKTEAELLEQAGTEDAEYLMKVDSQALGMSSAQAKVEQAGAEIVWDEAAQQNYATWGEEGVTYKIWLEDAASIEAKLKLMKDNGLAGTAAWALGQEDPQIWELIIKYVN